MRRIAQAETHQEAVELGLGQRERAFVVDRVLRGDHQEWRRQHMGHAIDRDARLGHRLEQRGLGPRRRAVDFVGQQQLGKDRTRPEFELGRLLIEDRTSGHVGRQQVGRALNAFEGTADAARQRPGEHRLGHARHVLQQNVPLREPGHQRQNQLSALADDHLLDVGDNAFRRLVGIKHRRNPWAIREDAVRTGVAE